MSGTGTIVFLVWFVLSFITMTVLNDISKGLSVAVMGQYFLGFGIVFILKSKKKSSIFLILIIIGLFMLIGGIISAFNLQKMLPTIKLFDDLRLDGGAAFLTLICLILFGVGFHILIKAVINKNKNKNKMRCSIPVDAVLIDYKIKKYIELMSRIPIVTTLYISIIIKVKSTEL